MKRRGDRIVMVTAYDAPSGRIADDAGVDLILVGDSAAMVVLGHDSTVPATVDEMIILTRAVNRGARRPLIVADLPFGSYQVSDEQALETAVRFVKEARADAVKLEGAGPMLSRVRALTGAGIPVMGHIGLTPQTATMLGGFKAQGRTAAKAAKLYEDALALESGRVFLDRARGGSGTDRGAHRAGARDPDDRDRRRRCLRRPGARVARPARALRGKPAALRQAVRAARTRDQRCRRALRRRRSRRCVPRGAAHVLIPDEELALFEEAVAEVRSRLKGERDRQHCRHDDRE